MSVYYIFFKEFIKSKIIVIDWIEYYKKGDQLKKIIKDREQIKLISKAHQVGHEGIYKTYNWLKIDYYGTNMKRDVGAFIKCCHRCQISRPQELNKYS